MDKGRVMERFVTTTLFATAMLGVSAAVVVILVSASLPNKAKPKTPHLRVVQ